MYSVDGIEFKSFTLAVNVAKSANSKVIEVENGLVRWRPAAKVSAKKIRQFDEQRAAYEAQ